MKHKAYLRSTRRLFIKHLLRLLSISAIFIVTVSLISGLGDVEGDIKKSINASYQEDVLHDLTIRGPSIELANIKEALEGEQKIEEIDKIETYYTFDTRVEEGSNFANRAVFRDLSNQTIDKLELLEGNWPKNENEVVVERSTKDIKERKIGDVINVMINPDFLPFPTMINNVKVVGVVKNPTMVILRNEPSDYYQDEDNRYINEVVYFDSSKYTSPFLYATVSALNISIKNRTIFDSFNEAYRDKIDVIKGRIEEIAKSVHATNYQIVTLNECYSLVSLDMYAEKVGTLAMIFIIFFILIAILVIYSTMSRLLDEERSSMAVLKTLGYSNLAISARYIAYVIVAGLVGVAISVFPSRLVSGLILNAFNIQYAMKEISLPVVGNYFFMLSGAIVLLSTILTFIKSMRTANYKPIELLTPRAPKPGKRVLIERIKPFWKRLSFKYKSTFRNVFFFKGRLAMTILSIMSATVLVFASFGLLNNANVMEGFESLRIITIMLLAFSAALCALVIYNITNINISERTREIATLMVLGYRNNEVTGYVYREIYILTAIGAILGLPAGVGFLVFVFDYIGVFELSNVEWWSYLVSPILTFVFALLATRLLHMKIVKTDMNESLKVLE
ncbi:MAG: ABC transporter permease [Bacilli bacterium]|nr:ABC transporter permease [Bacilli bacterium]